MSDSFPVAWAEVIDNSTLETHSRCPRLALYQYGLSRAPSGRNFPIGFGIAYHKFREILEQLYIDRCESPAPIIESEYVTMFTTALSAAIKALGDDPPLEHTKAYLNQGRLITTCQHAYERWRRAKSQGELKVLFTEQTFTLELPLPSLPEHLRLFGGRFDQLIDWNNRLWVVDFKTTSRMGASYGTQFEPRHQFTGYVWAAQELSGRQIQGVMVEVVYNTKTKGPEFFPFLSTRNEGNINQWLAYQRRERKEFARNIELYPELGFNAFVQRTSSCDHYGGCYFRECCNASNQRMAEAWLEDRTIESHWDFMNPEGEEGVAE